MRRFIAEISSFALLQAAILALLLWRYSDINRISPFMPALEIKQRRLETAPSPRLILIGGSNLLFGIDSPMIESQLPYHVVNMGLLRSLRLDFIFNQIDDHVRAGDVVIICLEYSTLNGDEMGEQGQLLMSATTRRLANLRYLTWEQWRAMLDLDAMQYFGMVFRQSLQRIGERRKRDDGLTVEDAVNDHGDLTRYHDPAAAVPEQDDQTTLVRVRPQRVEAGIERMNEFIARWRERGVQVMYVWPPICRSHYEQWESRADEFHALVAAHLQASVICKQADMVFDDVDFIGRSYHLRGTGVQRRTQRLIDALQHATPSPTGRGPVGADR